MSTSPRDAAKFLFNLETASIMLLDGDSMSMNILSQILLGFGAHNLFRCETIDEAKKRVSETTLDLIILDPASLGSEGYDFVPWLRRGAKPNSFVSVLMATGHTQTSRVGAARDSGANFVITKPLTPAIMLERIMWLARDRRPFIDCRAYAGPDRRFKSDGLPLGEVGRRAEDKLAAERFAPERQLSQSDVDSIMTPTRAVQ